jgi:hypothetical protein
MIGFDLDDRPALGQIEASSEDGAARPAFEYASLPDTLGGFM